MSGAPDSLTLLPPSPATPDNLAATRADIGVALAAGKRHITIDLDAVAVLDSPLIATLIAILRAARECGATVSLRAGRRPILETLRATALDQVFAIEASVPEAVPVVPVARRRPKRLVAGMIAALLAAASLVARPVSAAADFSPAQMLHNVVARNADMRSYQASVAVDVRLRSFPYVMQRLVGTTYFRRPDNFEVVFEKVPSYAKGFDRLYSDIADPTDWAAHFNLTRVDDKNVRGHRDVVLRLVQKVRGMIDHENVAIDPSTWCIDEMEWHYDNGGFIAMSQDFQRVGDFMVPASQHATIRIPFVHAAADATYSQYKTNVAIADGIFTHGRHP